MSQNTNCLSNYLNKFPLLKGCNFILNRIPILNQLLQYFKKLVYPNSTKNINLTKFLFLIGIFSFSIHLSISINKFIRTWYWLPFHYIRAKKLTSISMKNKYGDCWVAITGYTDGIGLAYAKQFASMGFNLLLIGRNENKMKKRNNELQHMFPELQIKCLQCNLSDENEVTSLIKSINTISLEIDIGIFINNAGMANGGKIDTIEPINLVDLIQANYCALCRLTQTIIPILRNRQKRSALLNLSSCLGVYFSPMTGTYSFSKCMIDVFTRIIAKQNADLVDVLTVRPFGVTTNLMKMKKGPNMITPEDSARSSIADLLAGETYTFTGARHKMSHGYLQWWTETQVLKYFQKIWTKI